MTIHEINFAVNISYGDNYLQDKTNSDNLMFIFWGIIIPIISVMGYIGNLLTIIVLWRREMTSVTVYFLRTLVVTDTAIIFGSNVGLSTIAISQIHPEMWEYTDVIYPKIYTPTNYIVMTLQMINVWVTVAVSVERYIAICHPFRSVHICKKKYAYILIAVIVVISVLYNIPRCFATWFSECQGNKSDRDCFTIVTTSYGVTFAYSKVYFVWMYMILIYIIPLVALSVLNTLLILELMRMRKRRSVTNQSENIEMNMSLVLILIVIVFISCQTPGLVAQFEFLSPPVMLQWMCVSNTLVVLNSSVNFLIYTAVGKNFRKTMIKMFKRMVKHPSNEFSKSSYSQTNGAELAKLNDKRNTTATESEDVSEEPEACSFRVCR